MYLEYIKAEGSTLHWSAHPLSLFPPHSTPRPLTVAETKTFVQWYANAADEASNEAGFDGAELPFAHGYLPDQFLQDIS